MVFLVLFLPFTRRWMPFTIPFFYVILKRCRRRLFCLKIPRHCNIFVFASCLFGVCFVQLYYRNRIHSSNLRYLCCVVPTLISLVVISHFFFFTSHYYCFHHIQCQPINYIHGLERERERCNLNDKILKTKWKNARNRFRFCFIRFIG